MGRPMHQLSDVFKNCESHRDPQKCCHWLGGRDKDGYGKFGYRYKTVRAHVAAFCSSRGMMIDDLNGKCVLHQCDNPICINPTHLFLGTHADNVRDKVKKGRAYKLSQEQVRDIRSRYASGNITQGALAKIFGVTILHIHKIVNGLCRTDA